MTVSNHRTAVIVGFAESPRHHMSARIWVHTLQPFRGLGRVLRRRLTIPRLARERRAFEGRGGTSEEACADDFAPAFLDTDTGVAYLSRYPDGRPAPVHLLGGLPEGLVRERDLCGGVTAVKGSVVAGFVRRGHFYTREETARLVGPRSRHRPQTQDVSQAATVRKRRHAG